MKSAITLILYGIFYVLFVNKQLQKIPTFAMFFEFEFLGFIRNLKLK